MRERKLTFEDVCLYAEKLGCGHREGPSKAKNVAGQFFYNHWTHRIIMPLYEGPKRTIKGKNKPEVCWWCLDSAGNVSSVPSRYLRMMDAAKGLAIWNSGYDIIINTINKEAQ